MEKQYITEITRSKELMGLKEEEIKSLEDPEYRKKVKETIMSIDELIKLHTEKVELLKKHRTGLKQKLVRRGEWEIIDNPKFFKS